MQTNIFLAEQEAKSSWFKAESDKFRIASLAAAYQREQLLLAAAEAENFGKRLAAYHDFQRRNPAVAQLAGRAVGLAAVSQGPGPLLSAALLVHGSADGGQYLNALWWDEMSRLYARMRERSH